MVRLLKNNKYINLDAITSILIGFSIKSWIISLIVIFLFAGCNVSNVTDSEKISPQLKKTLNSALEEKQTPLLQFTGKCSREITDEMKKELSDNGITIYTVAGDIFTGMGTPISIISITELDFVSRLKSNSNYQLK